MGTDCPGTRLGRKVTKSAARRYGRELLKRLTERSDGGKKLTGSGWILSHFQKKPQNRLGAVPCTESDDPACCVHWFIYQNFPFQAPQVLPAEDAREDGEPMQIAQR